MKLVKTGKVCKCDDWYMSDLKEIWYNMILNSSLTCYRYLFYFKCQFPLLGQIVFKIRIFTLDCQNLHCHMIRMSYFYVAECFSLFLANHIISQNIHIYRKIDNIENPYKNY